MAVVESGLIGQDKSEYQVNSFLISTQKHVVGTHYKRLMSTHNMFSPRAASNEYPQHVFMEK